MGSSSGRMLSILDLFTSEASAWGVDDLIEKLGCSRPTGYRYVRELCAAGLLMRTNSRYYLGPRIIELDYRIRQADPLSSAGAVVMRDLGERTGWSSTLATMFSERIVTLHLESRPGGLDVSYGRGRPLPLFRGAPSKLLLAYLPRSRQVRLFETNRKEATPLARSLESFLGALQDIRRAGFATSDGELDPGNAGISVPVFDAAAKVVASLCLVIPRARLEFVNRDTLVALLNESSQRITRLANEEPVTADIRSA